MGIVLKSEAAIGEVRDQVIANWRDMRDDRDVLEERWKRCLMNYLCEFNKKWVEYAKAANRSHRFVGLDWDAVETITPQIYDTIFGRDESLHVKPIRLGGDSYLDDEVAEQMRHLLRYQMRFGKYQTTTQMAIKQMLVLGNCPWTVEWKTINTVNYDQFTDAMNRWVEQSAQYQQEYESVMRDYEMVAIRSRLMDEDPPPPPQMEPPPEPDKDLDVIFQGPVLRIGSIFNYVQEQHPNDDFGALRIMRSWRTKAYLKELAKPKDDTGYRLYERLENVHETESPDTSRDNDAEHLMKMALGMTLPRGRDKVEVKEQHGTFEINKGGEKGLYENYVVTLFNDEVVRCEPSPFFSGRPQIQNARLIKYEGAVYGIGIIEKAMDESDSANAVHNQTIDAVNTVIQPEFEVVEDDLADGTMKRSGPGVKHKVLRAGTITPIQKNYQGIPMGAEVLNMIIARHERMTGAINTAQGSDESATRTNRNTNIIATKLGGHVEAVELELINESLNMAMEMNAQYLDDTQVLSVVQEGKNKIVEVNPRDIRRGWLVYSAGSKYMAEKQERIQNMMMAIQMSEQRSASGLPSPVNEAEIWRRLFQEVLGESDDLVMTNEEYQQKLAQHQAMMQQQMLMQQGGPNGEGGQGSASGGPGNDAQAGNNGQILSLPGGA